MPKEEPRKGRKTKDSSGKTQQELAEEHGVSLATWKRWEKDKELVGAALVEEVKRSTKKKIDTEREKIALGIAVAKMEYLPKQELEVALAEIAAVDDQYDSAILSELPSRLEGLSAPEIERELGTFVDEWKEERANAFSDTWKAARAGVEKMLRGDLKKAAAKANI